jgi:FkbM family methyltransferase
MRAVLQDIAGVARLIRDYPLNRNALDRGRAWGRFLAWQALGRLTPDTLEAPFVNGTRLRVKRRLGGRLHYVLGMAEFDDMAFVAHLLRPGEVFADVGANIGAYSLVAAAAGARCVAFEPAPQARRYLEQNVASNGLADRIELQACAVGAAAGSISVTAGMGEINHVLRAGESTETLQVPMASLDGFFAGRTPPVLIKIDVEGFETEVVRGADGLLAARKPLALLLEMTGHGARYGYDEAALRRDLVARGYALCRYEALSRRLHRLDPAAGPLPYNLLFIRDPEEAQRRLREAAPLTLGRHRI